MIELFSAATPNGYKVSILLEELGAEYQLRPINLRNLEQKQEWFLKMNPNGRIPVIVDKSANDFVVFESGAILIYLAEKFGKFLPSGVKERSVTLQWLMFQMGGVGPMQGQAGVFYRYAPEKIPYAIERYQKETRRLYQVLDNRLRESEYLAGDYSIADMATWPWVRSHDWVGLDLEGLPHLEKWVEKISERPAVQRGILRPPREGVTPENARDQVKNMLV